MMSILAVPFAAVAAWLLYEALWQAAAPLRFRVLALAGFLLVVTGVYEHQVPVIVVGLIGFAVGEGFATLYTRTRDHAGWTAPMPKRVAKRKGRRRRGGVPQPAAFVSEPELVSAAEPGEEPAAETTSRIGAVSADVPTSADTEQTMVGALSAFDQTEVRVPSDSAVAEGVDAEDDPRHVTAQPGADPYLTGGYPAGQYTGAEYTGADGYGADGHGTGGYGTGGYGTGGRHTDEYATEYATGGTGGHPVGGIDGSFHGANDYATGVHPDGGTDLHTGGYPVGSPSGAAAFDSDPVSGGHDFTRLGLGLTDEWPDDPTNTLTGGLIDSRARGASPYGPDQYATGQYGPDQYGTGQYGTDQYGTGHYGTGQYGANDHRSDQYQPEQHGAEQQGEHYGAGLYASRQYTSEQYERPVSDYGPDPADPLFGSYHADPGPDQHYAAAPFQGHDPAQHNPDYFGTGAHRADPDWATAQYPTDGHPPPSAPRGGPYAPDTFGDDAYAADPFFADPLHPAGYASTLPTGPYAGTGVSGYGTNGYPVNGYTPVSEEGYDTGGYGSADGGGADRYGSGGYPLGPFADHHTGSHAPGASDADPYGTAGHPLDYPSTGPANSSPQDSSWSDRADSAPPTPPRTRHRR